MQQGIKFAKGMTRVTWFLLVLSIGIAHTHGNQKTDTYIQIYFNTTCYVHKTAIFITLSE